MRSIALPLALVISTVALYATLLDYAPIYLAHDEVMNAVNAHAIATAGRDPNGRLLPLYIHIAGNYWATPIVTYTTALFLTFLPVSEITIRLASVLVGVISVVLMYGVARRLFRRQDLALIAAAMLALTPAHFIHSRMAVDQLYPIPFVLGWLWCLAQFLERPRPRVLFAGTLVLGLGLYTYLASLVMMPFYLVLTGLAIYKGGHRSLQTYAIAAAGFALPALLFVPWLIAHPTQLGQQATMYGLSDNASAGLWSTVRGLASYTSLTERTGVFYQGFNPSMLFFSGGQSLINGTHRAGVFLFPIAVLLPMGLYRLITGSVTPMHIVLLGGFASAPLAGALVSENTVNRMLVIIPFAILLSTYGAQHFLEAASVRRRVVGLALLALLPLQFAVFYSDYMGDYRVRSAFWFERNTRDAMEAMLASGNGEESPAIYLSGEEIPWVDWYWKFYVLKHRRAEVLDRTIYFVSSELDPKAIAPGARVLSNADSALKNKLVASGLFRERAVIKEPDGKSSFVIFQR